ncbi:MAG: sulfatase [Candidatus Paceibacterota bacterium]
MTHEIRRPRRPSRHIALLVLSALMAMLCSPAFADDKPLNVLFLSIDDLRPELGCYGVERAHSPAIDELAQRGLVFDRAYCQIAQCNQTRASMLTGLRPDTIGVHDLTTHFRDSVPDAVTMPQWFRKHGYHAQSYGKIYHRSDPESWSAPHGFPDRGDNLEAMIGPNPGELKRWLRNEAAKAGVDLPEPTDHWKPTPAYGPLDDQLEPTLTDATIARHGVEVLGEMSKLDEPWFLAIGFIKPHMPFVTPQRYWDLYDRDSLEIVNDGPPRNVPPVALHHWPELRGNNYGLPPEGPMPDHLARNMTHAYLASVSFVDAQVARVLAELDRLGLRDDTIIVLWGDHGWQLGDHGCWSKHTVFEAATRSPLIIAMPDGKAAGRHTRSIVEFTDLYPTLCELAALPLPDKLDGVSFSHLLDNPDAPARDAALSQWDRGGFRGYAIRTDRYRYVEWLADLGKGPVKFRELYDHDTDPSEMNNIAADAEAKLLDELSERLTKLVSTPVDAVGIPEANIPEEMTDPSDHATFQWLLERANAEPEVHYKNDQIEAIDLGNTVIPPADIERLKKELPNATIEHKPIAEIGKLIIDNWKGADRKLRKWAPAEVLDAYVAEAKGAAK